MSTAQYQDPCRDGVREKRGCLQVMRHKYGDFEIWETIPNTLPDGRVMRRIDEQIELERDQIRQGLQQPQWCLSNTLKAMLGYIGINYKK